ncbi:hypothetical protein NDU88_001987 [Pleurodeles waltl]|uniref:Uncharacterized protein n=1 Tax=Pleurodeles waltl TaxID=8319 RepID=A0AAV7KUA5_PLEWA|nr:hypothetical protein NDU88_001987 [Pleurodeles waltl]
MITIKLLITESQVFSKRTSPVCTLSSNAPKKEKGEGGPRDPTAVPIFLWRKQFQEEITLKTNADELLSASRPQRVKELQKNLSAKNADRPARAALPVGAGLGIRGNSKIRTERRVGSTSAASLASCRNTRGAPGRLQPPARPRSRAERKGEERFSGLRLPRAHSQPSSELGPEVGVA